MLRMLVALDFSDSSRHALSTAMMIAERAVQAELLALHVLSPHDDAVTAASECEHSIDKMRGMVEGVRARNPSSVAVHFDAVHGDPADIIAQRARTHHADVIVLGTHSRKGIDRLLLGSVAETVVREAPCSVLTVKPNSTR